MIAHDGMQDKYYFDLSINFYKNKHVIVVHVGCHLKAFSGRLWTGSIEAEEQVRSKPYFYLYWVPAYMSVGTSVLMIRPIVWALRWAAGSFHLEMP